MGRNRRKKGDPERKQNIEHTCTCTLEIDISCNVHCTVQQNSLEWTNSTKYMYQTSTPTKYTTFLQNGRASCKRHIASVYDGSPFTRSLKLRRSECIQWCRVDLGASAQDRGPESGSRKWYFTTPLSESMAMLSHSCMSPIDWNLGSLGPSKGSWLMKIMAKGGRDLQNLAGTSLNYRLLTKLNS